MRLLCGLILVFVMLAGQVHTCNGSWVLPDGTDCDTCAKGPCQDQETKGAKDLPLLTSKSGDDCHRCCTLRACDKDDQEQAAVKVQPVQTDLAMIQPVVIVRPLTFVEPRSVHINLEACFPNAPPAERSSRAPPIQLS